MYASLYVKDGGYSNRFLPLVNLAQRFSPQVEANQSGNSVTFSIAPLRKLIGSPHQIAAEICRAGYEHNLAANLALAANPDAAILLARHFMGVTLVTPGDERLKLASIPLAELFAYDPVKLAPAMLEILLRWGVKTCEDLVALPEQGVVERLGDAGVYLRNLAAGNIRRPLRLRGEPASYAAGMELEHALQLLEPLLFLLSRAAGELCQRLRSQSRAARELELTLQLDAPLVADEVVADEKDRISQAAAETAQKKLPPYVCRLEFPVPLDDPRTLLKLLQLHLERHPPGAPVRAFGLRLEPVEPRRIQGGIFLPPTPAPDKLQVTLARIAGMVGAENVGTPVLLNTHRPDAFTNVLLPRQAPPDNLLLAETGEARPEMLRLAMRVFRPALQARVQVLQLAPQNILAAGVRGNVLRYAGPWKTAGEWWTSKPWSRDEWDVALDDGALYRIYRESASHEWFVQGIYD
jgi:protein ImuB